MTLKLIDDGTLDTVFYCTRCRTQVRTHPETVDDETGEEDMTDAERIELGRTIAAEHECDDDTEEK